MGHGVGGQTLLARYLLARHHHRRPYRRVSGQYRFDFAQLNAEPANFHLIVVTPQELDGSSWRVPNQVPSLVKPRAGPATERIGDELLRS